MWEAGSEVEVWRGDTHDLRQWDGTLVDGTDTGQGHSLARLNFNRQALDPGHKSCVLPVSKRYLVYLSIAPWNVALVHSS